MKRGNHYDLYIGGKSKGGDACTGTLFRSQILPEELYNTVDRLIEIYQKNGKKREEFSKFVQRLGIDQLEEMLA